MKNINLFIVVFALANSCVKIPSDNDYPDISKYTIYVAGQPDYRIGCYWKNGERTDLTTTENYMRATTTGISVSGGNVYVSGHYKFGDMSYHAPCYWKNGIKTDLPLNGNRGGYTNDIFVSGSDVYVAGMVTAAIKDYREILQPCYWKNNTLIEITDYPVLFDIIIDMDYDSPMALPPVELTCIYVSGSDVYIGGNYDLGGKNGDFWGEPKQACYWKNGDRTDLPGNNSFVNGIFVEGGKVYISGGYDFISPGYQKSKFGRPCYWMDGKKVDLTNKGNGAAYTSGIFVEKGTVYVSGHAYNARGPNSCYWKDKSITLFDNKSLYTSSIFVKDGIVFICGAINEMSYTIPCYWANKKRIELSVIERDGDAIAISVE